MKRSKTISKIQSILNDRYSELNQNGRHFRVANELLDILEHMKYVSPPAVKSKDIKGENYPWAQGCPMRCNCDDCNPDFLVYQWEKEDEKK